MPGHNYIESINEGTSRSNGGKMFQIFPCGTTAPASAGADVQGYMRGAILINPTGNSTTNTVYVNLGTTTTASWTALTVS
jgi:hypothetical protein